MHVLLLSLSIPSTITIQSMWHFFNAIVLAQILFPFPLLPLKLLCCHRHHHHRSDLLSSITPSTTKGIISNNKLSLGRAQAHPESYAIEPLSLFHSLPHSCAPLSLSLLCTAHENGNGNSVIITQPFVCLHALHTVQMCGDRF